MTTAVWSSPTGASTSPDPATHQSFTNRPDLARGNTAEVGAVVVLVMELVRDARAEAEALVGADLEARVLEPSPPAVADGPWFADDPVAIEAPARAASPVVAPAGGDLTWDEAVAANPELGPWAARRWLTSTSRLPALPAGTETTRVDLHRLATYVIAPARHQANGKFGLRWTAGGFGTPFFGADRQIRVEGGLLVVQDGDRARSAPITTLGAAAELIGSEIDPHTAAEHDSPPVGDRDQPLTVDPAAVEFLSAWWGLGTAALERLRADPATIDPSRVQLWPGHFDPAIEAGDDDRRASYGASPGDHDHPEPYLYVSVWWPDRLSLVPGDEYWNADGYVGALLPYREMVAADDQIGAAVEFFRTGRDRLAAG